MAFDRSSRLAVVPEEEAAPDAALRQMPTTLVHDLFERLFSAFIVPRTQALEVSTKLGQLHPLQVPLPLFPKCAPAS